MMAIANPFQFGPVQERQIASYSERTDHQRQPCEGQTVVHQDIAPWPRGVEWVADLERAEAE